MEYKTQRIKNKINEQNKSKKNTWIQRTELWLPEGKRQWGGQNV